MSLSMELELQNFPKHISLKDGTEAMLRPLNPDDEKQLHELFLDIPEPERMFIKHRVQDIKVLPGDRGDGFAVYIYGTPCIIVHVPAASDRV